MIPAGKPVSIFEDTVSLKQARVQYWVVSTVVIFPVLNILGSCILDDSMA